MLLTALVAVVASAATPVQQLNRQPQAPLRVCGLQIHTVPGDTAANLNRAQKLIRANPGYDLYVLPELSSHGYGDAVLAALDHHAQDADTGEIASFFADCAREANAHICYGFLRRREDDFGTAGGYFICQAVATPKGTLALTYDKIHLCDMGACSEVGYGLTRGSGLGVFEIHGIRVGVSICYDLRFPELYRALAWEQRCDLLLHPCAFVRDATFPTYHQFCIVRAQENGVYLLSVNHAGADFGDSIAVPPWTGPVPGLDGELAPVTLGIEEGVLPLVVEPAHLSAVRAAYPYRRDAGLGNLHGQN